MSNAEMTTDERVSVEPAPEVVAELERSKEELLAPRSAISDCGYVRIGPRSGDVIMKVNGFKIAENPTIVICQARQMTNYDHGWPDQFVVQVIETATTFVRIRVRRVDRNGGGWGQDLRVDIIIIN